MTRALLVEFAAIGRFHRALEFPFVQGHWRVQGIRTKWLRFALPPNWRQSHQDVGIRLDEPDLDRLLGIAREQAVTHVLFNLRPSEELVRALTGLPGPTTFGLLAADERGHDDEEEPWQRVPAALGELNRFAGIDSPALAAGDETDNLFDTATPDFGWEPGNDAARSAAPIPFLICGEECHYRRRLARNPRYRGLDLTACMRDHGCAFCNRPAGRQTWRHGPEQLFARQLRALQETHPPGKGRLAVRAVGAAVLGNIEAIADELHAFRGRPLDLLLDARADTLLAARPALARALARLTGTEHRLHLALIGIESFVARELELLNKGTTWQQNLTAARTLFELEHEFPGHFAFREHGGLSLLLYTPWTRPEELALNLGIIRFSGLHEVCGKIFTSRVRLYDKLPIARLAARDGLLADAYADTLLDTARSHFYAHELPWRFEHPALEPVSRVLVRMTAASSDQDDPLARALTEARTTHAVAREPLSLAIALVDAAIDEPTRADPEALLSSAVASLTGVEVDPPQGARAPRMGPEQLNDSEITSAAWATRLLPVRAGLKPVMRIEDAGRPCAGVDVDVLRGLVPIVRRWNHPDGGAGYDLFLGRDESAVEAAIEATSKLWRASDESEWKAAASRVGALLGYPGCCARAFAERPSTQRLRYTWIRLLQRLAQPSEVPAVFNPGSEVIDWVPCSLDCQPSQERAAAMLEMLAREQGEKAVRQQQEQMCHPWLVLIDHDGAAIELLPESDPTSSFTYRAGARRGAHRLLDRVATGDRIELDDQQLCVLRAGRLHAALGARAFIWWHQAAIQRELWQALAEVRFSPKRTPTRRGFLPAAEETSHPHPLGARLAEQLGWLLAPAEREQRFAGFEVTSIDAAHAERARITLRAGTTQLRVLVAPRETAPRAYAWAGPLAVMHPAEERLETAAKQRAVRALARKLEQHYVRDTSEQNR
jgi:hypothetical protein